MVATRVGFTGGAVRDATDREHGDHAEAIERRFDPDRIDFRGVQECSCRFHDPTTRNR